MEYLIIFIYIMGVALAPYFIDYMNAITETDPDDKMWVEVFLPWLWPIMLVMFVGLIILYSPALLKDLVKRKFNDQ